MGNILLIEPNYKNKYPPLGLMKIAYFHKYVLHDYVRFTKGELPAALSSTKWDRVYVTTLFTFEWDKTIKAINYAKTLVDSIDKVSVGGIAATLMPDEMFDETGIYPVLGLLNEPGKLGLPGDECIDQIIPDYSILDDIDYIYPYHDAYFLSATKGCGMRCGFCAVQKLEPTYIPYMDIKGKIDAIDEKFGPKKDLLLMDNNVLISKEFEQIIEDIIKAGFGKGATYTNPKTGKRVRRYVDFNQGLDANLLARDEHKAELLGKIALRPARIAFDHIEDRQTYETALRYCAKYGITELSNYVLYNSEDFGGKGKSYHADTHKDLYDRMRITIDIQDDINSKLKPGQEKVSAFSFPMRYIPLDAHERGYVGSQWDAKSLRAVQCMMIPTQGKGVGSRSFFEADFGKNSEEFERYLYMPDHLIASRGKFSTGGRGRTKETQEEVLFRRKKWEYGQKKINEWNRLYDMLGDETKHFKKAIADNEFLPEKLLGLNSDIQKKLYLFYLTPVRLVSLLGMVQSNSPTYILLKKYILEEFSIFYDEILEIFLENGRQKNIIIAFIKFFGKKGVIDILEKLKGVDFENDKLLANWDSVCKKNGVNYIDFELIRVYLRYRKLNVLSEAEQKVCKCAICQLDMMQLGRILERNFECFKSKIEECVKDEHGQSILTMAVNAIFSNIQLKFDILLEEYCE